MSSAKKSAEKKKSVKPASFNKKYIVYVAAIILIIAAVYFLFIKKNSSEPQWVKNGEVTFINAQTRQVLAKIDVEAAITPAKRQQGLMFRSHMDENKGMLFIFEHEDFQSFWMKNTLIPLDIIFINSKGVINTIHKNTVPYSEKSLPSKARSQFVVEVNAGFCNKYGINEGDLIEYKLFNQ